MSPPEISRLREHFDGISARYYSIVDRIWYDVGYYHRKEREFLEHFLGSDIDLAIDAGCGPGRHTAFLSVMAKRVVALDISHRMLQAARNEVPAERRGGVSLIQADIRHMPLKDGVADAIVNMEVLEHLPRGLSDAARVLREFRRVLRPGGALVTEVPLKMHTHWLALRFARASLKELTAESRERFYVQSPLEIQQFYYRREVERLIRRAGFGLETRTFVRVLPAGLVERVPQLASLDRLLEKLPLLNGLAREVIWRVRARAPIRNAGGDIG